METSSSRDAVADGARSAPDSRRAGARHVETIFLALGIALRLALALVNREANDNHIAVARVIADENRMPATEELWEGFQPKLYHSTVAAVWRVFSVRSPGLRIASAELVSCAAGIATVLLIASFLRSLPLAPLPRLASLAIVATNSSFVGISAQATNDTFVILFATIAALACRSFVVRPASTSFALMIVGTALAGLSKGNGLVLLPVIVATLATLGLAGGSEVAPGSPERLIAVAAVYAVVSLALIVALGPYVDLYRRFGSPFVTNWAPPPPPHWFEATQTYRPGIRSIASGFFTFRWLDLLMHPVLFLDNGQFPESRTSLWTLLYARFNFSRFPSWPPSWQTQSAFVRSIGRAAFAIALLPTAVLLTAIVRSLATSVRAVVRRPKLEEPARTVVWAGILALGYLAFIVVYAFRYRDHPVMKDLFVLPAIAGFAALFALEIDALLRAAGWRARLATATVATAVVLSCVYAIDISALIAHLA